MYRMAPRQRKNSNTAQVVVEQLSRCDLRSSTQMKVQFKCSAGSPAVVNACSAAYTKEKPAQVAGDRIDMWVDSGPSLAANYASEARNLSDQGLIPQGS